MSRNASRDTVGGHPTVKASEVTKINQYALSGIWGLDRRSSAGTGMTGAVRVGGVLLWWTSFQFSILRL